MRSLRGSLWPVRLALLTALVLWSVAAGHMFDLHRPLQPTMLLACFGGGFVLSVALVLKAPRIDFRWFALLLAVAHGLCGLLVDVALAS